MIIAFGSINLDLVTRVAALPGAGETALGPSYAAHPGGKGANQALAARRAGARVALVGATGRDDFARQALALLRADGVDLSGVAEVDAPTGAAFIGVDARGENQIIVASGANAHAKASQLRARPMTSADTLLLQREVPEAECLAAALHAKACGARVILNLAPAGAPDPDLLDAVDMLVVNEHEARTLGAALRLDTGDVHAIALALSQSRGLAVIVTLGAKGAVGCHGGIFHRAPAPALAAIDTTGAGDTFVGALAAALDAGRPLIDAMAFAVTAGSLACTKAGAQPSIPTAAAIEAFRHGA